MELSPQQDRAAQSVHDWLRGVGPLKHKQVYRLFGNAGTGKTTLAMHLASAVEGQVYFSAYTGKATYVLRQKGCPNPMTLHKLIYLPKTKGQARLRQLEENLEKLKATLPEGHIEIKKLQKEIDAEHVNLSRPAFNLNLDSPLRKAALLVVDEVSMVDEQMGRDLESFGCKILVLGDPAQLPPVRGTGYFTDVEPDFMLTEIHRQARDNPIIALATDIRQGRMPAYGCYGQSRVCRTVNAQMALGADQILVGRNETRGAWNRRVRELLKREGEIPVVQDKLVCLRNSRDYPLLNGSLWTVTGPPEDLNEDMVMLRVADAESTVDCLAHKQYFRGEKVPWWARNDAEEFDYGYALTVHKSQGSQWDDVLIYDESSAFRQDRWKWLYTAVTRAAKRVEIVMVA